MKENKTKIIFSILLALAMIFLWPADQFDEQLIRLEAENELGDSIKNIQKESVDLQAVLLDYSDDQELILKSQIALIKYPQQTRTVLLEFGSENSFKDIFLEHGEVVIPVINYFLITDIKQSIKFMDNAGKFAHDFKDWWSREVADDQDQKETLELLESDINSDQNLTNKKQAWYSIQFIKNGGHDFLGQFSISPQGEVKWIQTERVVEGVSSFFTSGVRELETRYVTDQEITGNNLLWASVDVLAVAGTLKLLRASRQVARSGKSISLTRQTSLFGSRLLKSGFAGQLFKVSAIAGTGWLLIKHPSLITSFLAEAGELIGIHPMLAQLIGISLLAFVLLYPVNWFLRAILSPIFLMLKYSINKIS
ncbi:MAG: hypothetical protein AB8D52_03470 [Gammaproteobacteria bacterium]